MHLADSNCSFTHSFRALAAGLVTAVVLAGPAHAAGVDAAETRRLQAYFAEEWETSNREHPEGATFRGDRRYDDRLTDESPAARSARDAHDRRTLQRLRAFRPERLSHEDRLSLEIALFEAREAVEMQAFTGYRSLLLRSSGGLQTDFADLLTSSPHETADDLRHILARMAAYPTQLDQRIAILRAGMAEGWVSARPVLERVLQQIDAQLPDDVATSPFYEPFAPEAGSGIAPAERQRLQAEARRVIAERLVPAMRRLRAFIVDDYLPKAPADGALGHYPGGEKVYEAVVASETTTRLGVRDIHELGLRQVASLRAQMEAAMRDTGFTGDLPAFTQFINTDPRFYYPSGEALLTGYRDIAKRIDPELTRLFVELPRIPYGVRAMPAHLGVGAAEFYSGPDLDGTRPGWFNANLLAFKARPTWGMETLVAHEAVPGHHLQTARAIEAPGLPAFRRDLGYSAYSEGWALYAETLGSELGLYTDPYSRYGHLQSVIFRAARLVVDTGLHAMGWTRQQAIDYMIDRTGDDPDYIATEVDRYYSQPGQALAYMIGELKIVELRERARQRLGERFDIRRFHQVVLDHGALPLDVLERLVDEWIAQGGASSVRRSANAAAARR